MLYSVKGMNAILLSLPFEDCRIHACSNPSAVKYYQHSTRGLLQGRSTAPEKYAGTLLPKYLGNTAHILWFSEQLMLTQKSTHWNLRASVRQARKVDQACQSI